MTGDVPDMAGLRASLARVNRRGHAALLAAAQHEPQKVWFRLAQEAGAGSTHPTTRRRVLCLLSGGEGESAR